MPALLSKLQYQTYEKGEYSDEEMRSLEETINLIHTFPWEEERPLTNIQLTGPSVTVFDGSNYLKTGLYFNNKFCLYYLDNANRLYEYPVPTLNEACTIVRDFFNGKINLQLFTPRTLPVNSKSYFATDNFEYRIKPGRVLMLNTLLLILGIVLLVTAIAAFSTASIFDELFLLIPAIIINGILIRILYHAVINRNNYLKISKGNPAFYFGYSKNEIKSYDKNNIWQIIVYEPKGSRNPNTIIVFEICFTDGSVIKFSNMLISYTRLMSKFQEDAKPVIIAGRGSSLAKL